MIQRIAVIGDVHGCSYEFIQLYNELCWLGLDEIWCLGDLVDRGPHSGKVIDLCIKHKINSVMGNHDYSILNHRKRWLEKKELPTNPDKKQTLSQLHLHHFDYLESLPDFHVIDDLGLILVHGGLWPKVPLYGQPHNVVRCQMIHPDHFGKTRWWGLDAVQHTSGKTEEQSRLEGWERWYRLYDYKETCLFGHSTWNQPLIYSQPELGKCIGIDTGSCFGGLLTACIYDSYGDYSFISVKCKEYAKSTSRIFIEG